MLVAESILELIGRTPMLRLPFSAPGVGPVLLAKLEFLNPSGSVKDRIALTMVRAAEEAGLLGPGGVIVEPTSGNTGLGLAMVAATADYRCIFCIPDKVSPDKVRLLVAYGAEVVSCPSEVSPDDSQSIYSTAARLAASMPGAWMPNQYANPVNPLTHYRTTGPEIWEQTQGRITHLISGVGTGGTLSGAARFLKERKAALQVIAADPVGSIFTSPAPRPYLVEGVGEDFWPDTFEAALVDRYETVSDEDAFRMARHLLRTQGLLVGGSSGLALAAAERVAQRVTPEAVIVVMLPDSGRGYTATFLDNEWLRSRGLD
jgi:cystathionine beta-synthase